MPRLEESVVCDVTKAIPSWCALSTLASGLCWLHHTADSRSPKRPGYQKQLHLASMNTDDNIEADIARSEDRDQLACRKPMENAFDRHARLACCKQH